MLSSGFRRCREPSGESLSGKRVAGQHLWLTLRRKTP